jgi:peptidyl-prolyl cis-trans isomerase D
MESNKVNFAYVAGLYSTIKDSDVKITDAEIVDFMKKMKKYKAEESREVEYVLIEDKALLKKKLNKINSLLSEVWFTTKLQVKRYVARI